MYISQLSTATLLKRRKFFWVSFPQYIRDYVENFNFIRKGQGRDMKEKNALTADRRFLMWPQLWKKKGEHTCKKCGRNATIYFVKALRAAIIAAIAVSAVILAVWLVIGDYTNLWGMLWVFLPFLVFYACTPLFTGWSRLRLLLQQNRKKKKGRRVLLSYACERVDEGTSERFTGQRWIFINRRRYGRRSYESNSRCKGRKYRGGGLPGYFWVFQRNQK